MRDLVLVAAIAGVLPFALLRPWIGVLAWIVVSIAAPHQMTWTLASQPVAQVVAIATLLGWVVFRDGVRGVPMRTPVVLLLLLWTWTLVTTSTAFYPEVAWERFVELSKMLFFVLLALTLFQDVRRLRVLMAVLVGSLGFFAVKGAVFSLFTGGQHRIYGPMNTSFYDNNDLALGLCMILPMAIFVARTQERRAARWIWGGMAASIVLAILFTYSRGGMLALGAVVALTILRSRQRVPAIGVGVVVLLAVLLLAPPQWMDRVSSIGNYEEDGSVSGRFNAWHFSWNVAADNPVTGGGFGVFTPEMYGRYAPDPEMVLVAHSVYFDLLASHGVPGLLLFLALAGSVLWRAGRLRRRAGARGAIWFAGAAEAVQLGLVGFLVGGAFLSQTWNELFWYLVATQVLLEVAAAPVLAVANEQAPLWEPESQPCAA